MDECGVRLYALSTCIHCKHTKEFLTGCGITFECIEVDKLDAGERTKVLEEIRKINSSCSFPTIIIGETVIVGFREHEIKKALGL